MTTYFWLASEFNQARRMYEGGSSVPDIAAAVGRTEDAVWRAVSRHHWHRPEGHERFERAKKNAAWPRIAAAITLHGPMTVAEITAACGGYKTTVLRVLAEHRAEMHIARWQSTTRKPAAVWALGKGGDAIKPVRVHRVKRAQRNPFLVAAGSIRATNAAPGRVIKHLFDDDLEAAA